MKSAGKTAIEWMLKAVPFFVSAGLFLSGVLAFFSPLPILILGLNRGPILAAVACLTNALIVYYSGGPAVFQFYSIGVVGLVFFFLFFISNKKWSLERTLAGTWIGIFCLVVALIAAYANLHGISVFAEFERTVTAFFDLLLNSLSPTAKEQLLGELGAEEWRRRTLYEFPSALGISAMIMIYVNLHVIVSLNPNRFLQKKGLDRRAMFRWKIADHWIWSAIVLWGVSLLLNGKWQGEVAFNILKIFMAAYALQGLAILGSVMNAWKIRGFFRMFFYGLAVFFMMPLVIGVGFFDTWFDFRAKLRQS